LEEELDSPSFFEEDRWHKEMGCKQAGSLKVTESPNIIDKYK